MQRLATIVIVVIGLSGCTMVMSIFGSGEAMIVGVSLGETEAIVQIDDEAKTVAISVPPVAPELRVPVVSVSDDAELTEQPDLQDGVTVIYVVTAENGDVAEWEVTLTIGYGLSFYLGDEFVILEAGITDGTNPLLAAALGDGTPLGVIRASGGGLEVWTFADEQEWSGISPEHYAKLSVTATTTGSYTEADGYDFYFNRMVGSDTGTYASSAGELTISRYDEAGGVITGTFTAEGNWNLTPTAIDQGFFKVLRLQDGTLDS